MTLLYRHGRPSRRWLITPPKFGHIDTSYFCAWIKEPEEKRYQDQYDEWYGVVCRTPERKAEFEQKFGNVGQRWVEFWASRTFWRPPDTDDFDCGGWFTSYWLKDCFDECKIGTLVDSDRPLNFMSYHPPGDGCTVVPLLKGRKNRE